MTKQSRSAAAAVVLALFALPALAQQSDLDSEGERAWAKGIPKDKQEEAFALFREGNAALKESLFVKAAQKYRDALAVWDHPAIHYNLALALVNLDQPVETHDHLIAALKYGAAPLDSDKYEQALRYKGLVEKQLANVEIRCEIAGASVKLDGRPLFTGPGLYQGLVREGLHTVSASREGYVPSEVSENLPGGEKKLFDLKLHTADELIEYHRRWDAWIPWAVLAGGVAVAGGSLGMHLAAKGAYQSYDTGVTGCTRPETGGCMPSLDLAGTRSKGDALQSTAIVGYALGGAAVATGIVLVYLNRLQPYQTQKGEVGVTPTVTIAPLLGPAPGATALVTF